MALAQAGPGSPRVLPNATIVPDAAAPAADEGAAPLTAPAPAHHPPVRHHAHPSGELSSAAVEPSHAMLRLKRDTWAYARPAESSHTLERVHAGRLLNVTGSTHYYVQTRLKSGATGYVPISAVELTRPEDKVMRLATDARVVSEPNRYGKRLSEVHKGRDVHVIGISLNYLKIRMKSRLEGFIPITAVE